jgi:formylglycine-generating enzyme required for sulfatase activity
MGTRPVINVSWQDAVAFTEWLSAKSGRKFRLPSEAEWEFAARGGTTTPFPWGQELGSNRANCKGCGSRWDDRSTAPVGSFAPNGYGLHDVVGNVYEWCLDLQHDNYQGAPADGSPWLTGSPRAAHIYRGASFRQTEDEMPVSRRCWEDDYRSSEETGFRVLLEP